MCITPHFSVVHGNEAIKTRLQIVNKHFNCLHQKLIPITAELTTFRVTYLAREILNLLIFFPQLSV